jgi:glycosyltransferase involved in cell wall biosynthesis
MASSGGRRKQLKECAPIPSPAQRTSLPPRRLDSPMLHSAFGLPHSDPMPIAATPPIASLHIDTRPDWRGGQNQVLLTLRGLRDRGHRAELLALEGGTLEQRATASGFRVHAIPKNSVRLGGARLLRRILQKERFEIVHAHDPHGLTLAWLGRAHRSNALIAQRRVANPLTGSALGLSRYRAARRIFAVSRFVAESVVQSGIAREKIDVVYEGVELPAPISATERNAYRHNLGVAAGEILLGCVGYLLPEKGQEVLIRAMPDIIREFPQCKLIFAGDGPCRPRLEAQAKQLGVSASILFVGFVENITEIYRAMDYFLFPSLAEPLGTSMLAAMSYGLPVIGVASGGLPEMVTNETNGLLIPTPDANKFAAATLRLLRSPGDAGRLGAAARATIADRFTADRMVETTLEKYRQILKESPR